jgi:prophage regulatory protein
MQTLSEQGPQPSSAPRFLSRQELRTVKGINWSDATLYRKIGDGSFCKPVKLGANTNAWVEAEIDAWATAKIAERDSAKRVA